MERSKVWVLFSITTLALSLASGCRSDQLYEYRAHTDKLTEGASIRLPVTRSAPNQGAATTNTATQATTAYTVVEGDTLSGVAEKSGVTAPT